MQSANCKMENAKLRCCVILTFAFFIFHFSLSALADTTKTVLPNGLTVIVKPEESTDLVAIEVFIKAGAAEERESNAGIGNLVARTLLASTRNKRAETLASVVDWVGGNFETLWNPDYTEIRAVTTKTRFDDVTSLLGDILNNANFEDKWVDLAREDILTDAATQGDDVFRTTYEELRQKLYKDNPYHRPPQGYLRCIRSITKDDLQQFYQKYYVPNNIVVTVAGGVTANHAVDRMKMAFAGTSKTTLPKQRPIPAEVLEQSTSQMVERPVEAAYFMLAFLAPGATSPDYPAARVAITALGRGKACRMFRNIRDAKGLAYDLGTIYPTFKYQSHVLVYLMTDARRVSSKDKIDEIKKATLAEIASLQQNPLSPEELERAKRYTIGMFALDHERLQEQAFNLGLFEAIGLGYEFDTDYASKIEAVTAEDVQRATKQIFTNYTSMIVLPEGAWE